MRIAVTYDNGNIFQHFGRTETFKIYETEAGRVVSGKVIGSNGSGHSALVGLLADNGIDVLICGGIGGGARSALAEAGIELCAGAEGDADRAVEAYLKGELVSAGVTCGHHGEGHSCGHQEAGQGQGCGHHGEGHSCGRHEPGQGQDCSGQEAGQSQNCGHYEPGQGQDCSGQEAGHGHSCGHHEPGQGHSCGHHEAGQGQDCSGHEANQGQDCGGYEPNQGQGCCGSQGGPKGRNEGKTCRVHYRGTFNDGTQFDSSYDRGEPLEFVCGAGMMIRGFDGAVADMEVGQAVDIHLMPEEAYGMPDPSAVFTVEVSQLPGAEALSVGEQVYLSNQYGQQFPVRVTAREGSTITFDANHEMAGKELNFHIELVEVE